MVLVSSSVNVPFAVLTVVASYVQPTWRRRTVRVLTHFQTPKQMFPPATGINAFSNSVPSLCHWSRVWLNTSPPCRVNHVPQAHDGHAGCGPIAFAFRLPQH